MLLVRKGLLVAPALALAAGWAFACVSTGNLTGGSPDPEDARAADGDAPIDGAADALDAAFDAFDAFDALDALDAASPVGCSDGKREGFLDLQRYPDLAGCAGGWQLAGLLTIASCGRSSGNDSSNPTGLGCAAADLCAPGWQLCRSAADVAAKNGDTSGQAAFYATQQSGPGTSTCGPTGTNDFFGCGGIGLDTTSNCLPLNRGSSDLCQSLGAPWQCSSANDELNTVLKPSSVAGGVLCCRKP